MRFIQLSLPFNRLNRLRTSFSVRTRIGVIRPVRFRSNFGTGFHPLQSARR
jgi:hypothetical protein